MPHPTTVRPDALFCSRCKRWLADEAFNQHTRNASRRFRQAYCRSCQHTLIKQAAIRRQTSAYYHNLG